MRLFACCERGGSMSRQARRWARDQPASSEGRPAGDRGAGAGEEGARRGQRRRDRGGRGRGSARLWTSTAPVSAAQHAGSGRGGGGGPGSRGEALRERSQRACRDGVRSDGVAAERGSAGEPRSGSAWVRKPLRRGLARTDPRAGALCAPRPSSRSHISLCSALSGEAACHGGDLRGSPYSLCCPSIAPL